MTMHFCSCQKIAKTCCVPGCLNIIKKESMATHNLKYSEAHQKAMKAQSEALLFDIMNKVCFCLHD